MIYEISTFDLSQSESVYRDHLLSNVLYSLMQMSFYFTAMHHIECCIFLQTVVACVRMKGPWMKEPACVLV